MGECHPGNAQHGGTVLPIANLMADFESGSPVSYSSFLVTIGVGLSGLVSEIFACDRRTDGQTMQTITIAGRHIVAGQLIIIRMQQLNSVTAQIDPFFCCAMCLTNDMFIYQAVVRVELAYKQGGPKNCTFPFA